MTKQSFIDRLAYENIELSSEQIDLFEKYRDLILEWNERIDITAITEDKEIDEKHFIDSLSVFRHIEIPSHAKLVDIGTGGGFPGVPMKIFDPSVDLTLVDSLNKRIVFLEEVIDKLSLTSAQAIHARAEEIFRKEEYREKFDIAVSRAVAPLPTLLEYCLPAVKVGGIFLAMKGPSVDEEIRISQPALDALGGKIVEVDEFELTESKYQRSIILVKKVKASPKKYPRGQGKPKKKPLSL